jgi:phosphohistidine phosphatase
MKDFDRPLTKRGEADAKLIGGYLRKQRISPDVIISSPAMRARETTKMFLKGSKRKRKPVYDDRIYDAGVHQLLRVVYEIDNAASTALLVGHNPGFETLLSSLTRKTRSLPTASLACMEFPTTKWREVKSGILKWRVTPKELKRRLAAKADAISSSPSP